MNFFHINAFRKRRRKDKVVLIRIREIASIISIFPRSVIIRVLIIPARILLYSVHRMAKTGTDDAFDLSFSFSWWAARAAGILSVTNILSNAVILLPSRARYLC